MKKKEEEEEEKDKEEVGGERSVGRNEQEEATDL